MVMNLYQPLKPYTVSAYTSRGGYNFILVDSKRLSAGPWYPAAVTNTYVTGRHAAQFIDYLVSKGLPLENLHFIGMSIGAHAAGVAGHFMKSGKVFRITGKSHLRVFPLFKEFSGKFTA